MLLGPRELFLANAVYIPAFYTNLACLKKFNKKNIWWDNKKDLLYYKNNYKTFTFYKSYCNQLTLKYNKPQPRTPSKALFAI